MKKLTRKNIHTFFDSLTCRDFCYSKTINPSTLITEAYKAGYHVTMFCGNCCNNARLRGKKYGKKWRKQRKNYATGRLKPGAWQ